MNKRLRRTKVVMQKMDGSGVEKETGLKNAYASPLEGQVLLQQVPLLSGDASMAWLASSVASRMVL